MSTVRVGVRVRPLLAKEKFQNLGVFDYNETSITMKGQNKFTYDHVFGPDLSQQELYTKTAAPMLKNILEGYNVTIMAYGNRLLLPLLYYTDSFFSHHFNRSNRQW
jgi:hypothetical protein